MPLALNDVKNEVIKLKRILKYCFKKINIEKKNIL